MKKPFVSLEKAKEIINEFPTPFHLYDEEGIRERVRKFQAAFSWNKRFKEYFAVKATPNPAILKLLREEGCGADCSSLTELMMAEACEFKGQEIMFSSNVTPFCDYQKAGELKAIINLDDITHIDAVMKAAGPQETISCRFNPGGNFEVEKGVMDTPGDAKYGMTREQIKEAFLRLKELGSRSFGIHAFLASNTTSDYYYPRLSKLLFELAVEIKEETGISVDFINLSGGVGIPYRPDQNEPNIEAIGLGVKEAFEKVMIPAGLSETALFTELGRYILGPFGCLVTTAIHKKEIYKNYIGVDACAANLMRPAMYGAYHHITVLGKEDDEESIVYDITGGLCENNDKFAVERSMPEIDMGDILVIHDTGAHGFSMGYNYNGKLRSAEILLKKNGSFEMIRRAETPADYFATFDFTGLFKA